MFIAIVSDSHGDIQSLSKVIYFLNNLKIDIFAHLGDSISDLNNINNFNFSTIYKIPGTRDSGYDKINKRNIFIELMGFKISFSHTLEDAIQSGDIIISGHTHIPKAYYQNNKLYLNPGHIINNHLRYPDSTFMLLEIFESRKISVKIYNINFNLIFEKEFIF